MKNHQEASTYKDSHEHVAVPKRHDVVSASTSSSGSILTRSLETSRNILALQRAAGNAAVAKALTLQRRIEMRDVGRGEQSGFARLPELVDRLNAMSQGLTFSLDGRELQATQREGAVLSHFDREMVALIAGDPVIPLRLTNRHGLLGDHTAGFHDPVEIDAFQSGYVDVDDLLASTDLAFQALMLHFLTERAVTSNYARRIGTNFSDAEFNRGHAAGIRAEVALLRDFFEDPTIRFAGDFPAPTGGTVRSYRNSRGDIIRLRETRRRGAEQGVDAWSYDVRTRDGRIHTSEEYRAILEEERTARQVEAERLGGATEHREGGGGVPAP
jgi:hypothetical protein